MLKNLLTHKPGNELQVLTDSAKSGLAAIDTIVAERNRLLIDNQNMHKVIERLTLENEHLRNVGAELQSQRDFWMRTHARIEANLNQLTAMVQTIWKDFRAPGKDAETAKIASRFAPEVKDAKSVA